MVYGDDRRALLLWATVLVFLRMRSTVCALPFRCIKRGVNVLCKSHIRAKRTFEDFPLRFHHSLVCRKLHGICEPYVRGGAIGADEIAVVNGVACKGPLAATAATCKEEFGVERKGFPPAMDSSWVSSVYDGFSMYSARTSASSPQRRHVPEGRGRTGPIAGFSVQVCPQLRHLSSYTIVR